MSHTQEPWVVGEYDDCLGYDTLTGAVRAGPVLLDGGDYGQKWCTPITPEQLSNMMADARRICACVNACAGIVTETVESVAETGGFSSSRVLHEPKQQRDELLAALKAARIVIAEILVMMADLDPSNKAALESVIAASKPDSDIGKINAVIAKCEAGK